MEERGVILMFEVFVTAALLALNFGVLTLLVRLTRTRDAVWKNQRLLYEMINEQRELRAGLEEIGRTCQLISKGVATTNEADIRTEDQLTRQKNLMNYISEKLSKIYRDDHG